MNKKFITIVILFYVLPFKVLSQDIDDEIVTDTLTLEESDMYDHFLQIEELTLYFIQQEQMIQQLQEQINSLTH